jgi:hypothetical protein
MRAGDFVEVAGEAMDDSGFAFSDTDDMVKRLVIVGGGSADG